ncbi:MAG: O-antigen ligase family protein [Candidatus Moranbacteria bacterium]|nr:O-antigen ligase family protein [Candidatus Moranbacteria bacterium]
MIKIATIFFIILPFQFALEPTPTVDLALIRIAAVCIFLFWLARGFFQKKIFLPKPTQLFFFLAFFLWELFSITWADNKEWSLRKGLFLCSFLPLLFVFVSLLREKKQERILFEAFSFGAFLAACLALVQFFLQFFFGVETLFAFWIKNVTPFFLGQGFGAAVATYPSLLVNIGGETIFRAAGPFPDPHVAAFFFTMAFFVTLGLMNECPEEKRKKFFWWAGILLFADILTFSRGGYGGLFVGAIVFFVLFLITTMQIRKTIFFGIVSCCVFSFLFFLSPAGTRFLSSFSPDDTSNSERVRLWREAGVFFFEHPVLGTGLGNYPLAVKPTATYREPIYVHNLYLDIIVETGFVGVALFAGLFLVVARVIWKRWLYEKNMLYLGVLTALFSFATHSFFETVLFSVHVLPVFLLLLSVGMTKHFKYES